MGRVISTSLQFVDQFTGPSQAAIKQMQQMGRQAQKAGKQIQSAGKTITNAGSMLTNAITKPAIAAASALAGIALVKGFDRLKNIDDAKGSLKGLGHTAETVDAIMKDALTSVKGTAFGLGEAAQTAAGAVASGVEPGKELARVLSLTADAATIGKTSMTEMGAIFGKVQASNRVTAREANQMIAAGIPIYQMLAKASGKSVEQTRNDMSKGAISAEMFYNAVEQGMGGAAKYLGNDTVSGAIKNTGAAFGRLGAAFLSAGDGGGLFGKIAPTLTVLMSKMDALVPTVEMWGAKAGEAINKIVEKAKSLKAWFDSLSPSTKLLALKIAGVAIAAGPMIMTFGKIVTAVGTAVKTFGIIKSVIANFGGVIGLLTSPAGIVIGVLAAIAVAAFLIIKNWDKVKETISNIGGWFKSTFEKAGYSTDFFVDKFKSIWTTAKEIGTKIGEACKKIGQSIKDTFGGDAAGLMGSFGDMIDDIAVATTGAFAQITDAIETGMRLFGAFIDFFSAGFVGDWDNAAGGFRDSLTALFPPDLANTLIEVFDYMLPGIIAVTEAVQATIRGLVEDIKKIIGNLKGVFEGIGKVFKGLFRGDLEMVFDGFKQMVGSAIDAVGNIVKAKLNAVKTFAVSILSKFLPEETIQKIAGAFDLVSKGWDVAMSLAKGAVDGLVTAVRPLINNLKTVFKGLGKFVKSVFTGDWKGALEGLKTIAKGALGGLVNTIRAPFRIIGGMVKRVVKDFDVMKTIRSMLSSVGKFISKILGKCGIDMDAMRKTFSRSRDRIKNIINNLKAIFQPIFTAIGNLIKRVGNLFKTAFADKVKKSCTDASQSAEKVKTLVVAAFKHIYDKISPVLTGISGAIKTAFSVARIVVGVATKHIAIAIDTVLGVIEGITTFVSGVFAGDWEQAWSGIKTTFGSIFGGIKEVGKNIMNGLIDIINLAIGKINGFGFTTPDWFPGGAGGKSFTPNIPSIPKLYRGTDNWMGGIAEIHDRGAEIVDLPQGSRVYPNDKSIAMARQEGAAAGRGAISITINKLADIIEVRSDKDIDRVAEALALKMQKVILNMGSA